MPTIPVYNQEVSLEPQFTQGIDVRATPEAFGADIGRGLQDIGQGVSQIAQAKFTLQQKLMENDKRAAQIRTEAEANKILFDPDTGIMNRQGTNAVGAGKAFEAEVEKLRAEGSKGLQGQALIDYNLYFDQMIVERSAGVMRHEAGEVKKAVDQSFVSLADTYAENAVTYLGDPAASRRYIDEGVKVLKERAVTFGIDDATRDNEIAEYVRNAHKTVALTMAADNPLAAQAYLDKNREELGAGFYEALTGQLKPAVTMKLADEAAAEFFVGSDAAGAAASDGTEPADEVTAPAGGDAPEGPRSPVALPLIAGKHPMSVTKLDGGFISSMTQMFADMPEELRGQVVIYSGWRPSTRAEAPEGYAGQTQDEIFAAAVAKYGSEAAARKYAAPPGRSKHNVGMAADLKYGSEAAKEWVHANAAKYGLSFPMGHEPWHIEPANARGGGGAGGAAGGGGAGGTSSGYIDADAIEGYVASLPTDVQGMVRDTIYARFDATSKADTYNRKVANDEIFSYILQNGAMPTDPVLLETAGLENVAAARRYLESGAPVETDQETYRILIGMKAGKPAEFVQLDLNTLRDKMSVKDFEAMQADQRALLEGGSGQLDFKVAHDLSKQVVEAKIGPAPSTTDATKRRDYDARLAALYRTVEEDMRAYQKANKVAPQYDDILKMVTARTLPTVEADDGYDPGTDTGMQFEMFDTRSGTVMKLDAEAIVPTIPLDIYNMILADINAAGVKPTPEEIAARYEEFLLWSTVDSTD